MKKLALLFGSFVFMSESALSEAEFRNNPSFHPRMTVGELINQDFHEVNNPQYAGKIFKGNIESKDYTILSYSGDVVDSWFTQDNSTFDESNIGELSEFFGDSIRELSRLIESGEYVGFSISKKPFFTSTDYHFANGRLESERSDAWFYTYDYFASDNSFENILQNFYNFIEDHENHLLNGGNTGVSGVFEITLIGNNSQLASSNYPNVDAYEEDMKNINPESLHRIVYQYVYDAIPNLADNRPLKVTMNITKIGSLI